MFGKHRPITATQNSSDDEADEIFRLMKAQNKKVRKDILETESSLQTIQSDFDSNLKRLNEINDELAKSQQAKIPLQQGLRRK